MAKHIAMRERNDKGHECKRKRFQHAIIDSPDNIGDALTLAGKWVNELQNVLYSIVLVVFITLCPTLSLSKTIKGKVISVADGDTITILHSNNQKTKIRLYGIDTPEKAQAYGKKAKKFTAGLVAGKNVSVKIYATDKYGRSVGVVFVNGSNVNQEIIRNGYAWQYRKYCKASFCFDWLRLEKHAKSSRVGLWNDKNPVAPWLWRKNKRNSGNHTKSNIVGGTGIYHGNRKSKSFHSSSCKYYNCKNCTVVFKSKNDAVRAGYRAHEQCIH